MCNSCEASSPLNGSESSFKPNSEKQPNGLLKLLLLALLIQLHSSVDKAVVLCLRVEEKSLWYGISRIDGYSTV
jgi:hypothetical protein